MPSVMFSWYLCRICFNRIGIIYLNGNLLWKFEEGIYHFVRTCWQFFILFDDIVTFGTPLVGPDCFQAHGTRWCIGLTGSFRWREACVCHEIQGSSRSTCSPADVCRALDQWREWNPPGWSPNWQFHSWQWGDCRIPQTKKYRMGLWKAGMRSIGLSTAALWESVLEQGMRISCRVDAEDIEHL